MAEDPSWGDLFYTTAAPDLASKHNLGDSASTTPVELVLNSSSTATSVCEIQSHDYRGRNVMEENNIRGNVIRSAVGTQDCSFLISTKNSGCVLARAALLDQRCQGYLLGR